MVVASHRRKSHFGVGGAHGDAERRGRALPVGGVRVTNHQTFALQDDGFRVILSPSELKHDGQAEQKSHAGEKCLIKGLYGHHDERSPM